MLHILSARTNVISRFPLYLPDLPFFTEFRPPVVHTNVFFSSLHNGLVRLEERQPLPDVLRICKGKAGFTVRPDVTATEDKSL